MPFLIPIIAGIAAAAGPLAGGAATAGLISAGTASAITTGATIVGGAATLAGAGLELSGTESGLFGDTQGGDESKPAPVGFGGQGSPGSPASGPQLLPQGTRPRFAGNPDGQGLEDDAAIRDAIIQDSQRRVQANQFASTAPLLQGLSSMGGSFNQFGQGVA